MNKIVTSVVILGLLGAVGYLLYKRKKDSQEQPTQEPKLEPKKETTPEKELKAISKSELKLKEQLKNIKNDVVKNNNLQKQVVLDDLVVGRDKKNLQTQLLPKRPVYTGGGATIIETNIDKNVAPQRGVGRKEDIIIRTPASTNRPQEKLNELI